MVYGVAELPLHEGHVPRWMAERMKRLLRAILAVAVEEWGPSWVVEKLADPLWFQALNNIIGMDWDSSGSTTVLTGLLRQVTELNPELGLAVAGGKGRRALQTPEDLERIGERFGLSQTLVEKLKRFSRLAAATDSSLLQDGYQLYHHTVIVSSDGRWVIVQQGMNVDEKLARRYHILDKLMDKRDATLEPHSGIIAQRVEESVLDLTARRSLEARKAIVDIASESPVKVLRQLKEAIALLKGFKPLTAYMGARIEEKVLKFYRPVKPPDPKRIEPALRNLYEVKPKSIEELVLIERVGPATIRALALVAELIYGVEASHDDPAVLDPLRYAFAVGGKDGYPYPFNAKVADEVAAILEDIVCRARLGDREKLEALKRLRRFLKPSKA